MIEIDDAPHVILFRIFIYTSLLSIIDYIISLKFNRPYYFVHFLVNSCVVYITYHDVYLLYTDFNNSFLKKCNLESVWIIAALHIYHLVYHKNKIDLQDLIHHIPTLIGQCSIPLLTHFNGLLISHNVFYLCGLPGGIDYLLLFLTRNYYIEKITEKRINKYINIWIRCPGTIITSAFLVIIAQTTQSIIDFMCIIITIIFSYWNGLYYMERVLVDYTIKSNKHKTYRRISSTD